MASATNSSFDPYSQPVTIYLADGVTPVTFLLSDVDLLLYYSNASSINYSSQLGACFIMFFVLLFLTKESKRRTAMFILNLLSLLFGFFRALFLAIFFVSSWDRLYPQITGDLTSIPKTAYATSVTSIVFPVLMTITVNMSLVIQAYTVCKNASMRNIYRHVIILLSCLVLLTAVGFHFIEMVTNSMTIVGHEKFASKQWIMTGTLAAETASIWFFSIIFTGKLVWTLVTRRAMGWKQWSGVRILAAMGGCTMIIPSIFAGLEYMKSDAFPAAGSLPITITALLLPFSSLWAGVAIDQETFSLNLSNLSGSNGSRPFSTSARDSHPPLANQLTLLSSNDSKPSSSGNTKGSLARLSPTSIESTIGHIHLPTRDSTELDLEAMGVRVHKEYYIKHV